HREPIAAARTGPRRERRQDVDCRRGQAGVRSQAHGLQPVASPRSQTPVWERGSSETLFRASLSWGRSKRSFGKSVPKQEFGNEKRVAARGLRSFSLLPGKDKG